MRELNKEQLREIQLGILDYFVKICTENDISYFLDYGTLLGAVRHKGFIPWDDDIDVSMLRNDYEKLKKICRAMDNSKYRFSCVENDFECMYPFGKFIDEETVLYEAGEEGIRTGVYIDVFVYDNAPTDEKKRNKAFDKLDFYGHWRKYQLPLKEAPASVKRLGVLALRTLIKRIFPRQYFTKKIVESAKKYSAQESEYVYDITDPYYTSRWVIEKALFQDLAPVEFEGRKYNAPKNYDRWLTIQYGDYMKIPSLEEQTAFHHDIKAYLKE